MGRCKRRASRSVGKAAQSICLRSVRPCSGLPEGNQVAFLRDTTFSEASSRLAAWIAITVNFVRSMACCSRCGIVQFGESNCLRSWSAASRDWHTCRTCVVCVPAVVLSYATFLTADYQRLLLNTPPLHQLPGCSSSPILDPYMYEAFVHSLRTRGPLNAYQGDAVRCMVSSLLDVKHIGTSQKLPEHMNVGRVFPRNGPNF